MECWGGYMKGEHGEQTGELAFPDDAVLNMVIGGERLCEYLGGIFVAGVGDITAQQVELYEVRTSHGRNGDCYVSAVAMDGSPSVVNAMVEPGFGYKRQEFQSSAP